MKISQKKLYKEMDSLSIHLEKRKLKFQESVMIVMSWLIFSGVSIKQATEFMSGLSNTLNSAGYFDKDHANVSSDIPSNVHMYL